MGHQAWRPLLTSPFKHASNVGCSSRTESFRSYLPQYLFSPLEMEATINNTLDNILWQTDWFHFAGYPNVLYEFTAFRKIAATSNDTRYFDSIHNQLFVQHSMLKVQFESINYCSTQKSLARLMWTSFRFTFNLFRDHVLQCVSRGRVDVRSH